MTSISELDLQPGSAAPSASVNTAAEHAALASGLLAPRPRPQRLAADFDNFRKRTARDAGQKIAVIRELLPVVDRLELALEISAPASGKDFRRSIELTHRELIPRLERHGLQPDDPASVVFNPNRQESVSVRPDPKEAVHVVPEVRRRGHALGQQIIRPARVVVNDPSAGESVHHGD